MSTLQQIIEDCADLNVRERRSISDTYAELVVLNEDMDAWYRALTNAMGDPIKPAGVDPTQDHQALTGRFGGIRTGQTLLRQEGADGILVAMFWPWDDQVHTTLKMILLPPA